MGLRDRIVRWVLVGGAAATLLAWHLLGPWPALVLVLVSIVVAAAVYWVEPPAVGLDEPSSLDEDSASAEAEPDPAGRQPNDQ